MKNTDFQDQFNNLYHQNFAFAMKLTRNENDAKDLMQETALKVFSNLDKFKKNSNFKAWVNTIIRNNFISSYRKKMNRRKIELPIEEQFYVGENNLVTNEGPSHIRYLELQKLIDSLEPRFKEPFILYYQGYHYQEIADKLELSIGTIKSRIYFARKKIQAKMETDTIEENKRIRAFRNKLLKAS